MSDGNRVICLIQIREVQGWHEVFLIFVDFPEHLRSDNFGKLRLLIEVVRRLPELAQRACSIGDAPHRAIGELVPKPVNDVDALVPPSESYKLQISAGGR